MLTEIDDPAAALLAARYGASAPDVRLRWNSVVETLLKRLLLNRVSECADIAVNGALEPSAGS
jgi:hypothetical protein